MASTWPVMIDERHLQRERNQLPEAAAPGVDDLRRRDEGVAPSAATNDEHGAARARR